MVEKTPRRREAAVLPETEGDDGGIAKQDLTIGNEEKVAHLEECCDILLGLQAAPNSRLPPPRSMAKRA